MVYMECEGLKGFISNLLWFVLHIPIPFQISNSNSKVKLKYERNLFTKSANKSQMLKSWRLKYFSYLYVFLNDEWRLKMLDGNKLACPFSLQFFSFRVPIEVIKCKAEKPIGKHFDKFQITMDEVNSVRWIVFETLIRRQSAFYNSVYVCLTFPLSISKGFAHYASSEPAESQQQFSFISLNFGKKIGIYQWECVVGKFAFDWKIAAQNYRRKVQRWKIMGELNGAFEFEHFGLV